MNAPASQLASSLLLASVNLIQTMIPNLFRVVSVMLPGSKYAIDSITITLSLRCWFIHIIISDLNLIWEINLSWIHHSFANLYFGFW